jgi:Uma2 family endonuclease
MVLEQRVYTLEEFERIAEAPENADRLLELINGEIVEKVPTEKHGMIAGNMFGPLWNFVQQHKSGRIVMEVRYRSPDDQRNARIPDIAFSSARRPVVERGSVPEMPDLAVEVKSPDDTVKELREKARYFLMNGTRMVWLVYPGKRIIEVYTPDNEYILDETDTLSGGDVLPGFTLPVRDVFIDPIAEDTSMPEQAQE